MAQKPVPPVSSKPVFPISENIQWIQVREKDYPPGKDQGGEVHYHRAVFYKNSNGDISKVAHYAFGELVSEVYDIQKPRGEAERWVRLKIGKEWSDPEQYGSVLKKTLRDANEKISGVIFFLKDESGNTKRARTVERPKGK